MKTEASRKNQKRKKKPMENMLVWRCKIDDKKKIPVAWIGVLKPLFSAQDEQLIKTATKISVWNQPTVYFEWKDGSEYKRKEKSVLNKIKG